METLLRRLALAVGLACGLLGTQAPEFGQQYRQRLAGAVDELTRVVATFDAEARDEGITPDKAIERLKDNGDLLARERGRDMADDKARLDRLKNAQAAFAEGAPVKRLFAFFESYDSSVARRAWSDFQPAVPTTFEALVIGLASAVVGWATTHIVVWPARRRAARRRTGGVIST